MIPSYCFLHIPLIFSLVILYYIFHIKPFVLLSLHFQFSTICFVFCMAFYVNLYIALYFLFQFYLSSTFHFRNLPLFIFFAILILFLISGPRFTFLCHFHFSHPPPFSNQSPRFIRLVYSLQGMRGILHIMY